MVPLISVAELAGRLGSPGLVLLDATQFLPHQGRDGQAEYQAGHIPGALRFDLDAVADIDSPLPHMLPAPGRFARLVGALGVDAGTHVVVHDGNQTMWAARTWWMFGVFGHDRVQVLDGGLHAWRAAGRAMESGIQAAPRQADQPLPVRLRATRVRGLGDMVANLTTRAERVIDARSAPRFRGEAAEPRPGLRGGHIPFSRNLPYADLLQPNGLLRPAGEIAAAFAAAGDDGTRPVVTTCGSGVSAALLTLGRRVAGLPDGALYDGSWTEWASDPETPVETG